MDGVGTSVRPAPKAMAETVTDEFTTFGDNKSLNFGVLFCWLGAIIAIAVTASFALMQYSSDQKLKIKDQQLSEVVQDINSHYSGVEKEATSFSAAVSALNNVEKNRYLTEPFLKAFYARIGKEVVLKNISMSTDGKLSIDGHTTSYRAVANQILSLKEWQVNSKPILKNVQLKQVNESISGGNVVVQFSISAEIDKQVSLIEESKDTVGATDSVGGTSATEITPSDVLDEGGQNAEVQ